jgi:hypothetical protein
MSDENLQIMKPAEAGAVAATRPMPTAIELLSGVLERNGNVLDEKTVGVVKELRQMVREERDETAKLAFGKALFQLQKSMPEIYCDKAAKDRNQNTTFVYCSEEEILKMLRPHLLKHGFVTLTGQTQQDGFVTVTVTLIHEGGHQETRPYTVRAGVGNSVKDNTMVDTSAATSAFRHLLQKMFWLKSRISTEQDARDMGEYITKEQADKLEHRIQMINGDVKKFLGLAEAESFSKIYAMKYNLLDQFLRIKEQAKK